MSIRRAFDLSNLHKGFVAHTLLCISVIHRVTGPVLKLEHLPVRAVGVMGNGKTFDTLLSQGVHPIPESFRILRIEARKRNRRQFICAAKENIAVQVAHIIRR